MISTQLTQKFHSGQILTTPSVQEKLTSTEVRQALARHLAGDWGECDPEDAAANEAALMDGDRLFSVYRTASGTKFWIITEVDRSVTTVLLPEDY